MTARPLEGLSAREVLALAIQVEQVNGRRFRAFASVFRGYDADVTARFEELASEEERHEAMLTALFRERFGYSVPGVEQAGVVEVIESADLDDGEHLVFDSLQQARVYELALQAELGAQEFYLRAASQTEDPQMLALFRELAEMESGHQAWLKRKLRALGSGSGGM